LSTQPFLSAEDQLPQTGEAKEKMLEVFSGTRDMYRLAIKHGVKVAWGSDLLFSATLARRQNIMVTHLTNWYSNAELLKQVTAANGRLLSLSGERNPYPGKLGVIEAGALADLLVVDGNPLEDITLVARPEKSLVLIMKDGAVFKDALA
jgi:imidazolonepropionase-like amidohydrolase